MAQRCNSNKELEIHHMNRQGPDSLSNTQVLCQKCHEQTPDYGDNNRKAAKDFSEGTKTQARLRADGKCECIRERCHSLADKFGTFKELIQKFNSIK